ncbi:MAG: hypothetical protein GY816_20485 [Cytophagales bacterium]|nr:hypothetical protein [Cytophagales bacterium]
MKTFKSIFSGILTLISMSTTAQVNANDDNVANNGSDIVNYFTTTTAARGSKEFSAENIWCHLLFLKC